MRASVVFAALACGLALNAATGERDIYPATEHAEADIAAALHAAADQHKRVILDFGGNWCPSCHAFDIHVHDARNKPILDANFVLVHINVGRFDQNVGIASRYGIPLKEGVPALVLLDGHGNLLYRQTTAEAIAMEHRKSKGVTQLLDQWTGPRSTR